MVAGVENCHKKARSSRTASDRPPCWRLPWSSSKAATLQGPDIAGGLGLEAGNAQRPPLALNPCATAVLRYNVLHRLAACRVEAPSRSHREVTHRVSLLWRWRELLTPLRYCPVARH